MAAADVMRGSEYEGWAALHTRMLREDAAQPRYYVCAQRLRCYMRASAVAPRCR